MEHAARPVGPTGTVRAAQHSAFGAVPPFQDGAALSVDDGAVRDEGDASLGDSLCIDPIVVEVRPSFRGALGGGTLVVVDADSQEGDAMPQCAELGAPRATLGGKGVERVQRAPAADRGSRIDGNRWLRRPASPEVELDAKDAGVLRKKRVPRCARNIKHAQVGECL